MASESAPLPWTAATNWFVAGGSLAAAIAYDTTADDASAAAAGGGALLIARLDQPSRFCEVTVSFKEKHDIHRVYVRSTARTYEMYYATDEQSSSKDYLCTVRCSAATEGMPDVNGGANSESPKSNDGAMEAPEEALHADGNISDEDGWIKVKVPDWNVKHGEANLVPKDLVASTYSNFEVHYEATAEISDANPVVSLTIRLLSLQTKTCVHIDEIYIYADPIQSTIPEPSVTMKGNLGGTLLAMLAPGLLQMPNFGIGRNENRSDFDDSRMQENQHGVGRAIETSSSDTGVTVQQKSYCNIKDLKVGIPQEQTKGQQDRTELRACQKFVDPNPLPESVSDESNLAYGRVEKALDELVSRVGRIEAFCSRFEENMMKPLSCIETRLKRIEQQFDAFSLKNHTSEPIPFSRVAVPESSVPEPDPVKSGCSTMYTAREDICFHGSSPPADMAASAHDSKICPGLVVKAPEFLNEDERSLYTSGTSDSVSEDLPNKSISVSVESVVGLAPDSQGCPGLAVKAPEFVNEDDDSVDSYDALDSPVKDHFGDKTLCIDGAIASALQAFLTSTSTKFPNPEPSKSNTCSLVSSTVGASSKVEDLCESSPLNDVVAPPNNLLNESDTQSRSSDASELGREHTVSDDSSLLADDGTNSPLNDVVAPPNNLLNESETRRSCGASELGREHTVSDDSLLLADVGSNSGLIVVAPEFPVIDHNFICSDVASAVSLMRNCLKDQSPTALAMFLSAKMAKSSNCNDTFRDSSLEPSDGKNELAYSTGIHFEEENSARSNHGINIYDHVNLDLALSSGLPEGSLDQDEHFPMGLRSSGDSPVEGATPNSGDLGNSSQEKDDGVRADGWSSNLPTSDEDLTEDLLCRTGVCGSIKRSCLGGGDTDESDADEAAVEDTSLELRWTFSSTDSSLCENIDYEKSQADGSDRTSIGSDWGLSMVNLTNGHAAENGTSTQTSVESIISTETSVESITSNYDNNAATAKPHSDSGNERSIVEVERALRSVETIISDSDDITGLRKHCSGYGPEGPILDVQQAQCHLDDDYDTILWDCGSSRYCRREVPASIRIPSGDNDSTMIKDQHCDASPAQSSVTTGDLLFMSIDEPTVHLGLGREGDVQQDPGSYKQQPFTSLI